MVLSLNLEWSRAPTYLSGHTTVVLARHSPITLICSSTSLYNCYSATAHDFKLAVPIAIIWGALWHSHYHDTVATPGVVMQGTHRDIRERPCILVVSHESSCCADISMCARHSHLASSRSTNHSRSSTGQLAAALIPGTLELLGKARDALRRDAFSAADAEIVCALALAASGGHETLEVWCDDIAETRLGACQVWIYLRHARLCLGTETFMLWFHMRHHSMAHARFCCSKRSRVNGLFW